MNPACKIQRLRRGGAPRVLDLFSGCGGLSLGFHRAGCEVLGGVELDAKAARSHALNFHGHLEGAAFEAHATSRDITATDPLELLAELGHEPDAVDFLVGGPPCPAFTRVGRAKLREIHQHPRAFERDPRAKLYVPYLHFVRQLQPVAIVMENVPDLLNFGGHNLAEEICEVLEDLGYDCGYTLLNAASFGVPQMRERFVLLGLHRSADGVVVFPSPTRHVTLPSGYKGARDVALKHVDPDAPGHFVGLPNQDHLDPIAHPAVTVADAIGDLPSVTGHLDGTLKRGARNLSDRVTRTGTMSRWAVQHALGWPGFEGAEDHVTAHVIRSLSNRDFRIFRHLERNQQYPEAYALALELFDEHLGALQAAGGVLTEESVSGRGLLGGIEAAIALALAGQAVAPLWATLAPLARAADASRTALTATLEELRKRTDLPEGAVLLSDLAECHGVITTLLGDPAALAAAANAARATLQRRARLEAVYAAGVDEIGPSLDLRPSVPPVPHSPLRGDEPDLVCVLRAYATAVTDFTTLKSQWVPPYDPGKFPNKWRKMHPGEPARTLMAHLGKDSYSHIHYSDAQARTLSVREAARLQSFPDGFVFAGTMNPGFRQIGNAVPPLLAWAIARQLRDNLGIGEARAAAK